MISKLCYDLGFSQLTFLNLSEKGIDCAGDLKLFLAETGLEIDGVFLSDLIVELSMLYVKYSGASKGEIMSKFRGNEMEVYIEMPTAFHYRLFVLWANASEIIPDNKAKLERIQRDLRSVNNETNQYLANIIEWLNTSRRVTALAMFKNAGSINILKIKEDILSALSSDRMSTRSEILPFYTKWVILRFLPTLYSTSNQFWHSLLVEGRLKLFSLLDYIIRNKKLIHEFDYIVFNHVFTAESIDILSTGDLAKKLKMSKNGIINRIRDVEDSFRHCFEFLEYFKYYDALSYPIYENKPCIVLDSKLVAAIQRNENIDFTANFIGTILGELLYETHFTLPDIQLNEDDLNSIKSRSFFYIKQPLGAIIDFWQLKVDLEPVISGCSVKECQQLITDYIIRYMDRDHQEYFPELCEVANVIMGLTSQMAVEPEGNVILV